MRHSAMLMLLQSGHAEHEKHENHEKHGEHMHKYEHHDTAPARRTDPLTRDEADGWVRSMQHADGVSGAKWNMAQSAQVLHSKGYDASPEEWYAILNAMHADYCEVAKAFGVDNVDFYAAMANAWLSDEDAQPGKARLYLEHIAK